jgi:hypothetical protein
MPCGAADSPFDPPPASESKSSTALSEWLSQGFTGSSTPAPKSSVLDGGASGAAVCSSTTSGARRGARRRPREGEPELCSVIRKSKEKSQPPSVAEKGHLGPFGSTPNAQEQVSKRQIAPDQFSDPETTIESPAPIPGVRCNSGMANGTRHAEPALLAVIDLSEAKRLPASAQNLRYPHALGRLACRRKTASRPLSACFEWPGSGSRLLIWW